MTSLFSIEIPKLNLVSAYSRFSIAIVGFTALIDVIALFSKMPFLFYWTYTTL